MGNAMHRAQRRRPFVTAWALVALGLPALLLACGRRAPQSTEARDVRPLIDAAAQRASGLPDAGCREDALAGVGLIALASGDRPRAQAVADMLPNTEALVGSGFPVLDLRDALRHDLGRDNGASMKLVADEQPLPAPSPGADPLDQLDWLLASATRAGAGGPQAERRLRQALSVAEALDTKRSAHHARLNADTRSGYARAVALTEVARVAAQLNCRELAVDALTAAQREAAKLPRTAEAGGLYVSRVHAVGRVAEVQAALGDPEAALATVASLAPRAQPQPLTTMIDPLLRPLLLPAVTSATATAQPAAEVGLWAARGLLAIARAQQAAGDGEAARANLARAQAILSEPPTGSDARALWAAAVNGLLILRVGQGDTAAAQTLAGRSLGADGEAACLAVAGAQAERGDTAGALAWAIQLPAPRTFARALHGLGLGALKAQGVVLKRCAWFSDQPDDAPGPLARELGWILR